MVASRSALSKSSHVYLNGRTLEGGGQLVRIAIGLSALTGRPVSIDHVRGNRQGKKGLKRSHAAAVKLLAEISGSKISGGEVGSQYLNFFPQSTRSKDSPLLDLSQVSVKSEYDVNLSTAGAIFLVFQALYPYLLHVGSQAPGSFVKVNITGGTNSTHSPSYDYMSQVIVPNFARLGLPPLSVILHKRGWSSGPIDLGAVTFYVRGFGGPQVSDEEQWGDPVERDQKARRFRQFPQINIMEHDRADITQIDVTVLAPDQPVNAGLRSDMGDTVRQFIEEATTRSLDRELRRLDPSTFTRHSTATPPKEDPLTRCSNRKAPVPVTVHTSEATQHRSHVYILLVAHTSSGFRIGHDILGSLGGDPPSKTKHKGRQKQHSAVQHGSDAYLSGAADLVNRCVEGFIAEISNHSPTGSADKVPASVVKRSCLDQHMRDQIVVFEALGKACADGDIAPANESGILEDERDWTLHTKTAQWVCRQMLNV